MTVETVEPDGAEILRAIRLRLAKLAPFVEEARRLEVAAERLDGALGKLAGLPSPEAPYGLKADGTPRKRRPPRDPNYARKGWETRRNGGK